MLAIELGKFTICAITILTNLLGSWGCMDIFEYFEKAQEIVVYNEGKSFTVSHEDMISINNAMLSMCEGSHEMPAFGVSLDDATRESRKSGLWVEFIFENTMTHNDMPFDSLLMEVVSDYMGFNIIRQYNGKYEGRCYFVSLAGDMRELFAVLNKLIK